MDDLKNIELFLLDMDGTIYIENTLIEGASGFIYKLISKNRKYVFLTNNSSVSKAIYLEKLKKLGIPCSSENIFSSGMAMGMFLKSERANARIYLVGTKALEEELKLYGITVTEDEPNIVVVGYDRELHYGKLEKACCFLDNGAEFLATNPDYLYPIKDNRFLPDCGSICQMLTNATKKKPMYIGKPNRYMVDILSNHYRISHANIAIIGDRLYTDIATGKAAGIQSICVLTGETDRNMIKESDIIPDMVVESVLDLLSMI